MPDVGVGAAHDALIVAEPTMRPNLLLTGPDDALPVNTSIAGQVNLA
jgi:hypothetical protein